MELWTNGMHLWTRTVGSTVVGQGVDTILVMVLAYGGIVSNIDICRVTVSGYTAKVLYEVAMTPVTYLVINFLKRQEGLDILDVLTKFNPFSL